MAAVAAERRAVLETAHAASLDQIRQRMPLKGSGLHGAGWVVRAFLGGRDCQHRREGGGLAGVTPPPSHSGARAREQGLPKAGNRPVRWRTPEWAWSGLRYQPARVLRCWLRERVGSGGKRLRRIGLVAGARQLLMARWRCLQRGGVPAGAVLQEASAVWRCCVRRRPWGWGRRPVNRPGLAEKPVHRWGRLPQAFQLSSKDAERSG
jgi:transposase